MHNHPYILRIFISNLLLATLLLNSPIAHSADKRVIVLVPLEHKAMNEITEGIIESLQKTDAKIIIKNAHGDQNILLTLVKQVKDDDALVMPIGTTACQTTTAHKNNNKILCVATNLKLSNPLVATINDEIPVTSSLMKLPILKNIGVIYSASEKVITEIEELKNYADNNNLNLHLRMVQTLIDLPAAVKNMPKNIQAFLILKDHLIVNGINIFIKEADKRSIPVIASDEGSIISGATLAIGVKEKEIGIKSGQIAAKILAGIEPSQISPQTIDSQVTFININAFAKQQILSKSDISQIALPTIEIGK